MCDATEKEMLVINNPKVVENEALGVRAIQGRAVTTEVVTLNFKQVAKYCGGTKTTKTCVCYFEPNEWVTAKANALLNKPFHVHGKLDAAGKITLAGLKFG